MTNDLGTETQIRDCLRPTDLLRVGGNVISLILQKQSCRDKIIKKDTKSQGSRSKLFDLLWPKVAEFALLDEYRAASIFRYLEDAIELPGDLAECGVCRGGTSLLMAMALRELGVSKRIYMFDSFAGLPIPNSRYDVIYHGGTMRGDESELRRRIDELELNEYCVIQPGWFSETLPMIPAASRFCFVHLDGDLYESTRECLVHLYPRMSNQAPLVVDDYCDGSGGVQLALDEHVATTKEIVHLGPTPQVAILKGVTIESEQYVWFRPEGQSISYSVDNLKRHPEFFAGLSDIVAAVDVLSKEIGVFAEVLNGRCEGNVNLSSRVLGKLFPLSAA